MKEKGKIHVLAMPLYRMNGKKVGFSADILYHC